MLSNTLTLELDSHHLYARTPAGLWVSIPRSIRCAGYSMTETVAWGIAPPMVHRDFPIALSDLTLWQRTWLRWLDRLITMHAKHPDLDLKTMAITHGHATLQELARSDDSIKTDLDELRLSTP